ncbi:RHS repeat-associated core domain-containing protein, partial [Pseudomonas sp. MWU13-2100]|uniref:RHS repeat-associated core domain-containing protein n=1 Tax=Pseudomonas sp. MWU13-2100 TaxID=2935075 RepID=UPI00200DCEA5
ITEDDPIGRRMPDDSFLPTLSRWQQTSAIANLKYGYSVTQLNLFAKPDKIIRLTANGQEISELAYFYDGLGRTVDAIDALGHHTLYRYDAFDRMFESTLPGGDRIIRTYAAHSSAELPETLDIQPLNQVLPRVRTGEQLFDGLGRLTQLKVGPRMERFLYKGSQSQASDRLTAKGNTIHYEYAPNLVESPISSMAPDEQTSFDYDHRSARLTASTNSLGRREYVYDGTHQLKTERWIANNKTWTTTYVNSLQGRQLHRLEVSGIATRSVHDKAGRLRQVTQGNLQSHFYYDTLGRPNRTVSEDRYTGKQLESHLTYDDQGRETLRTISLSGHPTRTISQDWQNDDQLQCRHLQMDGQSLLREDFTYDPRGRLVQHDYSGTNLPTDSYGRPIVRQQFRFDVLDNITRRLTTFADTSTDVASFIYDAVGAPFLLTGVTHTNPPASVTFDYDDDGNMLNDQDNRRLFYDSQGRLLKSEDPSGTGKSEYRYDGHNHLVSDTQGTSPETLHFYQGSRLSNTVQGDIKIQYLYGQNHPLGQQQSGDNSKTLLLMTNASQSVIGESQQDTLHSAVYNAYGESSGDTLQSRLAFNGEARDLGTDWYLLGNGYRVYNPGLMRFHSPDSLSPFGSGGLNPYVYCLGNPIAFNDPTGHSVGLVDWRAQSDKRHDIQKAVLIASVSLLLSAGGTVTTLNAFAATAIAIEATSGALNIIDAINGNEDNQKTADALMWAGLVIGLVGGFGGGTKKSILPNDNWTFKQNPLYGSMKSPAQKHWLGRARNANWHLHFNNDDMPIFKSRPSIEDRLIGPLPVEVQGPDAARTIAYSAAFPSDFSTKADTFILDTGRAQVPQVLYISIVKSPPPPPTIVKLPPSPPTPTPTKKWPDVTINPGVRLTNNRELVNYGAAIRKI